MNHPSDCRVLVVDDTKTNIDVLIQALGQDYRLAVALDGKKAIEIATSKAIDLILLDIMMPELDGFQVCHRLKQDPGTRDIPIIFITAMDASGKKSKGFEMGAEILFLGPLIELRESLVVVPARLHPEIEHLVVRLEVPLELGVLHGHVQYVDGLEVQGRVALGILGVDHAARGAAFRGDLGVQIVQELVLDLAPPGQRVEYVPAVFRVGASGSRRHHVLDFVEVFHPGIRGPFRDQIVQQGE